MTISEQQRRTLDLLAESAGWNWADVEALSQQEFGECVAGLTYRQAFDLQDWILATAPWRADDDAQSV